MRQVRDQCVWTQRITADDLVPYLLEEAAELADAVESGTRADLREELGDVLWQVLFHAEIASEDSEDPFDLEDVARGLVEKMVRRHPHVFADQVADTPEQVVRVWNAAKAAEKHERTSVLDGVSARMPSLALAQKLAGRAVAVSAAVPAIDQGIASETELGEALRVLALLAQSRGWDAERALRGQIRQLRAEILRAESPRSESLRAESDLRDGMHLEE